MVTIYVQRMRALWPSLLCSSVLAVPLPPQPPRVEAQAHFNTWEFRAVPGSLSATRGGQEMWRRSGPFARPESLGLWTSGREVVLLSRDYETSTVILSAYALSTGRPLWRTVLLDRLSNADAALRGAAGRTLIVSSVWGEPLHGEVTGVSLDSGQVNWTARQDLLGFTDREVLVLNLGLGAEPMNSAARLPLTRVDAATGKQTEFTVVLPNRPKCGALNYQGSIPDVRFTHHFLYAFRQDACGKFIARVDWRAGEEMEPLIYPDRRPPTPAVK